MRFPTAPVWSVSLILESTIKYPNQERQKRHPLSPSCFESQCSIGAIIMSTSQLSHMDKIVSKTPLRISFVGEGTDLPSFYQKYGGAVINTAIDKYVTVTVSPRRDAKIRVSSPVGKQTVSSVDQIDHPIVRESMRKIVREDWELTSP